MPESLERLQTALADRYRIEREVGAGGMATVYLAEDLKHERKVAVKLLRPELTAILGAERFLNEIRVTSHLQHPHILQLYDSGALEGLLYYVMPYVEGESLRDRLTRERQLPVDEAVEITRAVASALDYAHRHGVIHRDIKPENILLHEGQALVADFGIALAVSAAGGHRLTETGLSLGTPHYMSPEQATGERSLDGRSDIYSLGCVAYEMLAGRPPHDGPTAQAIIAKIVTETPVRLTVARATVPPRVEAAIHKALERLPADRFQSAAQFADALQAAQPVTATSAPVALPPVLKRPPAAWRLVGGIAAVALLTGTLLGRLSRPAPPPSPGPTRLVIKAGADHQISVSNVPLLALSPDGSRFVYSADDASGGHLYLREMRLLAPVQLAGTSGGLSPTFSPDGQHIAFVAGGQIKRTPITGGSAQVVTSAPSSGRLAWGPGGHIYFTDDHGNISRVPEGGGTEEVVVRRDSTRGEIALLLNAVLPDGRTLLVISAGFGSAGSLLAVRPGRAERTVLVESGAAGALYVDGGYLVYALDDGTIHAAPFDARRLRLTGPAVTIAESVRQIGGYAYFAVAARGTLVYVPEQPYELAVVDRRGAARPVTGVNQLYHSPRFSPDGRRIAMDISQQGVRDVWVQDLDQGALSRLTFDRDGHDPIWSHDGRHVLYASARLGTIDVWWKNADGSGAAESLWAGRALEVAAAVTPDGREVVCTVFSGETNMDLWVLPLTGDRTPRPLLATPFTEGWPAISPDGKWLAYATGESGRGEVYVREYPGPGGRWQVSLDGGSEPVWSRNGRELFYRRLSPEGVQLVAATVTTSPSFRILSRSTLFDAFPYLQAAPHANYDVSPDGQRFVMVRRLGASEMVVVQNWQQELGRR